MAQKSITPEVAAANLARAIEHQRLSAAIKSAAARLREGVPFFELTMLGAWRTIISMSREAWDRKPHSYQNHLRYCALLDAADAIARAAIGEA